MAEQLPITLDDTCAKTGECLGLTAEINTIENGEMNVDEDVFIAVTEERKARCTAVGQCSFIGYENAWGLNHA